MLLRAMVALDDKDNRRRVRRALPGNDVIFMRYRPGQGLWEQISGQAIDLVVVSVDGDPTAAETVGSLASLPNQPGVVVVTSEADAEAQAAMIAAGALVVIDAALPDAAIAETMTTLVERQREGLQRQFEEEQGSRSVLANFVTHSPEMEALVHLSRRVAQSDSTILVLGETGVGKEWLARAIHEESARSTGPFIGVNCAAIPDGLVESELFGHREGAFTGARHDHRGRFELAHSGTIFLDEIAETPLHFQAKLLRVLQERSFIRVGGEVAIDVDVRVIAATNRDPQREIEAGRLREDLYYRLSVVALNIPPLRERSEDVATLADRFFRDFNRALGRDLDGIDAEVIAAFLRYPWPGNVRELINVMERAVLLARGHSVSVEDLPQTISRQAERVEAKNGEVIIALPSPSPERRLPLREARRAVVDAFERDYLTGLLVETGGRAGLAAKRAGVTPRALFAALKRHGIDRRAFVEHE